MIHPPSPPFLVRHRGRGALALGPLLALAGCGAPGGPDRIKGDPDAGATDAAAAPRCTPPQASESLPARADIFVGGVSSGPTEMFTSDLFDEFYKTCGACHVKTELGGFNVSLKTFATSPIVADMVLARIKSDDPAFFMPPPGVGGIPFSMRSANDPVTRLASLLSQWLAQGRPTDEFTVGGDKGGGTYILSDWTADHLTNIGDCVPTPDLVGTHQSKMDTLDAFFAQADALPPSLSQTDLDTFDTAALARQGVVAYVPTYPLWTDDAGKLRFIRVPRGQSVKFDKASQTFSIPSNTRFYKTFLKKVVDALGATTWRKIETRVIVARPDHENDDGSFTPTSLFGTYMWSPDETRADLFTTALNDGTGFVDQLIEVVTDEPLYQAVNGSAGGNRDYLLHEAYPGLIRHYAVPGSPRCIQCHMGSPTADFVVGFLPLQVARRPPGQGGIYETPKADELSQLERLIAYGVITGVDAPSDILPLEQAEGTRRPRNQHELDAQAYMIGNCQHCHNPRGFPSVKNPELKDALDFLPGPDGGVFQFPLDRLSPLRRRGANLDVPIPYITPSLRDFPVASGSTVSWTQKFADCASQPTPPECGPRLSGPAFYDAPWRSLVYRNVDTPFGYADDFAIFPHMPMNSPSQDCRAPRIMGDWMVSIPARQASGLNEDAVPLPGGGGVVDDTPQPYVEVKPGEPGYDTALYAAGERMRLYHLGVRYGYCPDTSDIVDHAVLNGHGERGKPMVPPAEPVYDPRDPDKLIQPDLGVPVRAHFVLTDLTEKPVPWSPRRADYAEVLVDQVFTANGLSAAELAAQKDLVKTLHTVTLDPAIRSLATTEIPFGLWQEKPGCDLSAQKKVADFPGAARPAWMDKVKAPDAAHVYMQSPGAAIFTTVCINCHGPQADAKGLLSDAVLTMTGGTARVANLRDGLFGPVASPGANRARVFGGYAHAPDLTADDWGARYLSFMTLGGTLVVLPPAILNIVAATRVLGAPRAGNKISPTGSPNMLKLAQELCKHVLPAVDYSYDLKYLFAHGTLDWGKDTGLVDSNADAEMWQRLCSLDNRMIVRVPYVDRWTEHTGVDQEGPYLAPDVSLYWADAYPANWPVLDHRGQTVMGVHPDNLFPMCIRKPTDAGELAIAKAFLDKQVTKVPFCPDELFAGSEMWRLATVPDPEAPGRNILVDVPKWATRGAINAGLSVFLYLDEIERGKKPQPAFNHCEELK